MDEPLMEIDTSLGASILRAISELSFLEGVMSVAPTTEKGIPEAREYAERAARARTLLEAAWNAPPVEDDEPS